MVHIREFQFTKEPELSHADQLVLDVYAQVYGIQDSTTEIQKNLKNEFDESTCYVMTDEADVVSVANYQAYPEQAYLFGIAVDKQRRNLGFGAIMMDYLHERTKELGVAKISLTAQGENATRFYTNLGYSIVRDDDPDYPLMEKSVT